MSDFRILNTEQLLKELDKYKFKQLHIHHTWKPENKDFKGNNHIAMQQGMYNYHTKNLGWQNIGQHVTLFPDGKWVTGRPFNITPASIKGWNTGAFAVEMVGNFDIGNDKLKGNQLNSILQLMKYFINKYGENSIKFHREGPGVTKTCPGTSLNKANMIKRAKNLEVGKVADIKGDNTPSTWAKESWEWAKKEGITDGSNPKGTATREEVVAMIHRAVK